MWASERDGNQATEETRCVCAGVNSRILYKTLPCSLGTWTEQKKKFVIPKLEFNSACWADYWLQCWCTVPSAPVQRLRVCTAYINNANVLVRLYHYYYYYFFLGGTQARLDHRCTSHFILLFLFSNAHKPFLYHIDIDFFFLLCPVLSMCCTIWPHHPVACTQHCGDSCVFVCVCVCWRWRAYKNQTIAHVICVCVWVCLTSACVWVSECASEAMAKPTFFSRSLFHINSYAVGVFFFLSYSVLVVVVAVDVVAQMHWVNSVYIRRRWQASVAGGTSSHCDDDDVVVVVNEAIANDEYKKVYTHI